VNWVISNSSEILICNEETTAKYLPFNVNGI